MSITQDMLVSEVITKWPDTVQVMEKFGFHCFGCGANQFETIEQGAAGHGMTSEELEQLVKELNAAAQSAPASFGNKEGTLTFTDDAARKLAQLRSTMDGASGKGLRIKVLPGGCAGLSYDFSFGEKQEGDIELTAGEVQVFVDQGSMEFLKGANVNYVESLQKSGFVVDNPNATNTCGCGSSFG